MVDDGASRFRDRSIHSLFEEQAARTPERTAVTCGDRAVSYSELDRRADQIAHHLRSVGARPEMLVAVYIDRSIDLVAGILGVLKSGAAYLPIDLDSPPDRVAFILQDASASAVLTQSHLVDRLPRNAPQAVVVDDIDALALGAHLTTPQPMPLHPTTPVKSEAADLAYVIYTSGSTGKPKGVLVEHRSVVGLLRGAATLYQFGEDDVWTLFHSAAFDVSVWEMWGALLRGGRLVVVPRSIARSPEDFRALCVRERVTVLCQTPSAFVQFIRADAAEDGAGPRLALRYIIFAGEALEFQSLRPWFDVHGDVQPRLVNMYGITETTVHVTFRALTRADADQVDARSLIGAPLPGYQIHILDEAGRPVGTGEVGEIWVGGIGVARGYLNRPELTAERFVSDHLGPDRAGRLYRSGDLGRPLPQDDIEYLGRLDHQVKIRGFRVEPGEIESVLASHAAIAQCVVVAREDPPNDKRLIAYWVAHTGKQAGAGVLRAYIASRLPEYMVPSAFIELAEMPLTINGKLDRHALPVPTGARPDTGSACAQPRDEMESTLTAIWSHVLGVEPIGIHDNFFELGGDSILAIRLASQIRTRLDVQLPLSQIFDHPTVAAIAEVVRALVAGPAAPATIQPALDGGAVTGRPMSFPQRGLWFLQQITQSQRAYLLADVWELCGPLDVESLRMAFQTIVARHAPLRTRFGAADGHPIQVIDEPRRFDLTRWDLTSLPSAAQHAEMNRLVASESDRPFNLADDMLLRAGLIALAAERHVLVVTVHHIASDAWSQQILRRELAALYGSYRADAPATLGSLPIQYADYAHRQQAAMTPEREAQLRDAWRERLAGVPPLELPGDRQRSAMWSDRGAEHAFHLSPELTERLQQLATSNRATLQMLMLAAYQVLLARYSGQTDFGVATPSAGRTDADVEDLMGLFVNTLVLRADCSGTPSFLDMLQRVRAASLHAYDHQDLPFETLVAELQPIRDRRRNPLAQVLFQFLPLSDDPPRLVGLEVSRVPRHAQRVRFDLEMTVWREGEGLLGVIGYSTQLFDRQTIERLSEHFVTLLDAIVADPSGRADGLAVVSAAERDEQLIALSGIAAPAAELGCVHELFESQARKTPEATALQFRGQRLTYGQLMARSGALARHLRALGVRPADIVAIHLERSVELVVSMLGVLRAGAAYLPLDPAYPVERLTFMLCDLGVETLVADRAIPLALSAVVRRVVDAGAHSWLGVDDHDQDAMTPASDRDVPSRVLPADLAYVMFTSGSTGQPKGVGVPHQAVTRLVRHTNYIALQPADRVAHASNVSFDAATLEVWGALLNGAQLIGIDRDTLLSPSRLSDALREHGVTVLFLTTALFHQLASVSPGMFADLRYLVVGGEALDPSAARAVLASGPPQHFLNGYGPTENTTFSTTFDVQLPLDAHATVPIGRPIASSTCYVLDPNRALLPMGAAGELYVGGAGLATQYLRRAELTADRFVAHPFIAGERLYRTGDRARWRWDGQLAFLGRTDSQVKLRGYRIELGEIEHTLHEHPSVGQCAVVALEDRRDDKRLVAYWVPRPGTAATPDALLGHLRRTLPDYMVPSVFIERPSLPLTAHGKLDLRALPPPGMPEQPADVPEHHASRLESVMTPLWADVLGVARVGPHDDFFELGGHSLSALGLAARIKNACGRHVSVTTVFSYPTIARMAAFLEAQDRDEPRSIVEVRRGGSRAPLYFPPGILGEIEIRADHAFLAALPPDQSVYALEDRPPDDQLTPSVEAIAERLCRHVNAFQPEGPICLAGYSFAGVLSYEMARQLQVMGRDIELMVIIDTGPDQLDGQTATERLRMVWRFFVNLPRWIRDDLIFAIEKGTPARLRRSLRKHLRLLRHAAFDRAGVEPLRVEDIFDVSAWPVEKRTYVSNSLRALASFRFGPYPGRLVLLRARTRPLFSGHTWDLGWRALAPALEVVNLPGNHYTITTEPHVRVLARALSATLESRKTEHD